ncbi:C45 family peptidase [[Clostridium] symbiosum]|uniref:C45 family autoproteolytic acyltransferase/hydolase n=1 Tax=Clostridium symbiosum TaxID=1512 RepID=UPI001D07ED5B|nr:C45 family peptidase [[Clostridium] symbiosum]MCB6609888.1 C45 family peptidase [[Clostridium] symbiosum]MCB6932027.1 C45 family peptidase [[Clostridium] symbiosum]
MEQLRKITVTGTPYEQGLREGICFCSLIHENINNIRTSLETESLNMEKYQEMTERNAEFLKSRYPDQWEEMKGIADGAGTPFEDILMINVPTYFMKNSFSQDCSMLLARGNATMDSLTYLIKNRDMEMTVHQVSVEYKYPDGSSIIEVNGAGIITYPAIGLNSAGLTITSTGFWSPKTEIVMEDIDKCHIFVNLHHLLQSCRSTGEVLKALDTYPRMNGLNIIAADRESAVLIETTRDGYLCEWADESGVLYRTNHFCLGDHVEQNPERESYLSTYLRYERIREMLLERTGKLRFQDFIRIMSDHTNSPVNAICRHSNPQAGTETVSCSITVLEDGELYTTPGNPCEHLIHMKTW